MDLLTLGETLVSLMADEPGPFSSVRSFRKGIGGAESNTAIGLARLGMQTGWVSRLGADAFGDDIVRNLRAEQVDVSRVVQVPDAPTALMIREFPAVNEARVHYFRQGSAASGMDAEDIDEAYVRQARRVHVTGVTLALGAGPRRTVRRLFEICADSAIPISFDPNFRSKLWSAEQAQKVYAEFLPLVSDLLLTEEEALLCTQQETLATALDDLERQGFRSVIVKRGAAGSVGLHDGRRCEVPATDGVVPMDPVGAGDAFNAGYLYSVLTGRDFEESLRIGSWVAGRVVGVMGDYEGFPVLDDLTATEGGRAAVSR